NGSSTTTALAPAASLYILSPTASGALTMSGNASINVPGIIEVESSSSSAISASASGAITATSIQVVGGVKATRSAKLNPGATTGVSSVGDPLAGLAAPSVSGTSHGALSVAGSSSVTIDPGIYKSISVSGSGVLTMNPGVYVIAGGGFSVSANGK